MSTIKEKQEIALAYKNDKNKREKLIAILKELIEKPIENDEEHRIFCEYVRSGAKKWNDDEISSLLSSLDDSVEIKTSHKEMNAFYSFQDIVDKFEHGNKTYGVAFVNNCIEFVKKNHDFKVALRILQLYVDKKSDSKILSCGKQFLYKMQEIIKYMIKPTKKHLLIMGGWYVTGNPTWASFNNDLFEKYIQLAKRLEFNPKEDL